MKPKKTQQPTCWGSSTNKDANESWVKGLASFFLLSQFQPFQRDLFYQEKKNYHSLLNRFPSGWACACSRPLWVSPMNSPVRLGVSPTAASTPTGVFNQRFEALFPRAGTLGCVVWPGAGMACSPGVFPGFYSPWVNVGLPMPMDATAAALV